uniref:Transmembrane protein 214 n=2 Tax=Arion vulgaris TaxID=1028688 RepID=A0A0B7A1B2_9EUPU
MASAAQWEVVGKSKKSKVVPRTLSKTQKKQFVDKMPRIDANAPVKEDKTIYSAFLEKEQTDQGNAASARQSNGSSNTNNAKKIVVQKKKKTDQDLKKLEKPVSLDAAVAQIDHRELESVLSQSQIMFPDNQDVWLKDLASYLNLKLEKVKDTDATFKGKPQGYPLELLPASSQKVLNSVVKKFSNMTLDHLFYQFVQTLLVESSKDQSTLGFKIFLQLLAHHKPDIVIGKTNQYLELLKTHQNRPSNCLLILWAVGQCGVKNFKSGLKVWLDLMLPALEVRQVAHYPVEYLEQLIGCHKKKDSAYGVITLREYFQVLDVVFSPGFNLSGDLRKSLTSLYPHIKELAHGETPSQNLRTFFPSYLARINASSNQAVKNEVLDCLVKCLTVDKQSFSVWCQLYVKHLSASGHLLEHINHEWSKLASQFDKKLLQETLRTFSVTNDEMESLDRGNREGLALCQAATKELTTKLTRGSFPWGYLLFLLVLVLASVVVYDINSSSNLRSSRAVRFLEHYGILALLEQAWRSISTFLTMASEWIKEKFPVYSAYIRETVGPFLTLLWSSAKDFVIAAELTTRPHRALVLEKAVDLYHWVYELSPETWAWCYEALIVSWQVVKDYTLWIWKHSVHLVLSFYDWLTIKISEGSLSKESSGHF